MAGPVALGGEIAFVVGIGRQLVRHPLGHLDPAGGELTVSLVAETDGLVGHVAFSPVLIADGSAGWYGLAPVAVLPEWQRRGVGAALIRRGLAILGARGAAGCVVLGDPAYYGRFGYNHARAEKFESEYQGEALQALAWGDAPEKGKLVYAQAFTALAA